MTYIPILYTTMLSVFIGYVAYIWSKYGVLKSISQSYYELPEKLQPLFTLFCWGFSVPAIFLGSSVLMFLAGAGICFVGAAAAFQERMTHDVHMIGAGTGVLFSQLAIFIQYGLWPINIVFILSSLMLLLFKKKINNKHIWWIEILAFISICIALGINLF